MKTALCITGTGRSIKYTFTNLKKYLLDPIEEKDIIVYVTKCKTSQLLVDKFSKFSNCYIHIVEENVLDESLYKTYKYPHWPPSGPQALLWMMKSRAMMNDLIDARNVKYDRVIFSRDDIDYNSYVESKIQGLDLRKIWLPHFGHWRKGYNDRFAVSNRENMRVYFDVWEYCIEYQKKFPIHNEKYLRYHLSKNDIPVGIFYITCCRVRSQGDFEESHESLTKEVFHKNFKFKHIWKNYKEDWKNVEIDARKYLKSTNSYKITDRIVYSKAELVVSYVFNIPKVIERFLRKILRKFGVRKMFSEWYLG